MSEQPLKELTLRQLFTQAERLTREMIEHLDKDFIPKAQNLDQLIPLNKHKKFPKRVSTLSLRNQAARLLESENFSDELYEKMNQYFAAIDESVNRLVEGT